MTFRHLRFYLTIVNIALKIIENNWVFASRCSNQISRHNHHNNVLSFLNSLSIPRQHEPRRIGVHRRVQHSRHNPELFLRRHPLDIGQHWSVPCWYGTACATVDRSAFAQTAKVPHSAAGLDESRTVGRNQGGRKEIQVGFLIAYILWLLFMSHSLRVFFLDILQRCPANTIWSRRS